MLAKTQRELGLGVGEDGWQGVVHFCISCSGRKMGSIDLVTFVSGDGMRSRTARLTRSGSAELAGFAQAASSGPWLKGMRTYNSLKQS